MVRLYEWAFAVRPDLRKRWHMLVIRLHRRRFQGHDG